MRRRKLITLMCIFVFTLAINSTYAALGGGSADYLDKVTQNKQDLVTAFDSPLNNIFGTIMNVIKVVAVAGIVIQGVKYMYAGPESKGKIKQSLIYLVIGTVLVFGVSTIVSIITNAWSSVA